MVSISNITETTAPAITFGVDNNNWLANSFTTGGTSADRFTLTTVVVSGFSCTNSVVQIADVSSTNTANPGTQRGSNLSRSGSTYTASGITLNGNTTYFVVLKVSTSTSCTGTNLTASDNQTGTSGWAIGDSARIYEYKTSVSGYRWGNSSGGTVINDSLKFTVNATAQSSATLISNNITQTGARLIIGKHTAAWWYKKTSPTPAGSCTYGGTGASWSERSVDLSGLTANTTYTYKAYSNNTCATELASKNFTTLTTASATLTPSNIGETRVTLTIGGHTAAWWYKKILPAAGSCTMVPAGTAAVTLQNLTAGTYYRYRAYSDSGCTTKIAYRNFTTPGSAPAGLWAMAVLDDQAAYVGFTYPWDKDGIRYKIVGVRDSWIQLRESDPRVRTHLVLEGRRTVRKVRITITDPPGIVWPDRPYTFMVSTRKFGAWSTPASVTLGAYSSPEHPKNVRVEERVSATTMKLRWTAVPGAIKYGFWAAEFGTSRAPLTEPLRQFRNQTQPDANNEITGDATNLPAQRTANPYFVWVYANNGVGWSHPSKGVIHDPDPQASPPQDVAFPAAPRNLEATPGDGEVTLSWDAVTDATGWEYEQNGSGSWTDTGSDDTVYTVTGLENGTEHSFKVRAVRLTQTGDASESVSATPGLRTERGQQQPDPTPTPPQVVSVRLSANPNPVEEGNPVTVRATLSRALPTATYPVNIPLALTPGTAESTDYGTLENIMITSGTSGTGTISTTDDTEDENDETFTVSLGELPQTVTAGSPVSVQVTIRDDDDSDDGTGGDISDGGGSGGGTSDGGGSGGGTSDGGSDDGPSDGNGEDICAFSQVSDSDDQSLKRFVECAAETLKASDSPEKTGALLGQFRDDEGNWNDGRTYLVLLTEDGEVRFHANDSDLEGDDWSDVLCEGEEEMSVLDLGADEGCFIGHEGARSGYAHAFSALNVDERGGEEFVLLGGFDETPSAEEPPDEEPPDEEPTDEEPTDEEPTGEGGGGGCAVAGSGGGGGPGISVAALALLLAVLLGRRLPAKNMAR